MSISQVTDATFDSEVLKAEGPVIVDFWAEWCGPCKMISPIIEKLANEMGDKVKVVKVNIDDNLDSPSKYGVRSIPTLMLFNKGKLIDSKVGVASKTALSEWFEANVTQELGDQDK